MKRRSFFSSLAVLLVAPKVLLQAVERLPSLSMVPGGFSYEDPFEAFRIATANLPTMIYTRVSSESVWMKSFVPGKFPAGLGETKRTVE